MVLFGWRGGWSSDASAMGHLWRSKAIGVIGGSQGITSVYGFLGIPN